MSEADRPGWTEAQSTSERVRAVALTIGQPRTANWIAGEADVAHETAKKYLVQLADDGQLVAEESDDRTTYRPDPVGQYLTEMRELYEAHRPDELADSLGEMNEQIRSWQSEYGVETPNELRATIANAESAADERERRQTASEWERLAHRRSLVEDALGLYDRFPGRSNPASA